MPRPRFFKLPEDNQKNLLDIAADAFASQPYHDVSYNKILQRAKVSKGASYYYFDDKEDLYLTVTERELDVLFEALEPVVPDGPFWLHLQELLDRYIQFASTNPRSVALANSALEFTPKANGNKRMDEWGTKYSGIAQSILEVGQSQGEVRTDLPVCLLTSMVMGIGRATDRWVLRQETDLESALTEGTDAFMSTLQRVLRAE